MDFQTRFNSELVTELERLFVQPETLRRRTGSTSPGDSNKSVWEEFRSNGADRELDDLDRLFRGMDVTNRNEDSAAPSVSSTFMTMAPTTTTSSFGLTSSGLQPLSCGTSSGYNSSSSSPGLEIPSTCPGFMCTGHPCIPANAFSTPPPMLPPNAISEGLLSKARLLEILRERERQKCNRRKTSRRGDKVCVFCRNNGEPEAVYTTHQLKDSVGKITCPVLYIYTCPICGASGEGAHTIKYCPLNPGEKVARRSLKTPRNSAGRRVMPVTLEKGLYC